MTKRNGGRVIRVLLAAASAVRRAGLEALVQKAPLLQLAGSLHSALAVAQYAAQLQPDVVLLDLESESPARESAAFPVVALIDEPSADWTAHALRSGVKAILPRDSGMEEILAAIQAAHAGLVLLDADVRRIWLRGFPHYRLNQRQLWTTSLPVKSKSCACWPRGSATGKWRLASASPTTP
jgi:DNA-binding NarL/FixJ family response regulator